MSDIAKNANRYGTENTKRSDPPYPHNGEKVGSNRIRFDCSGFVCHVIIESGYRIDYECTSSLKVSQAFVAVLKEDARPGDLILFKGHVGIVLEINANDYLGRFKHMSGTNNKGEIKTSYFVTDVAKYRQKNNLKLTDPLTGPDTKIITYGQSRPIVGFRRIKSSRYARELDLHPNNDNPFPTLRPLGMVLYSNYLHRKGKPSQAVLAQKLKKKPVPRPVKLKSAPPKDPLVVAVERVGTAVSSYRKKWEHWNGDLRAKIRFPHRPY